MDNELKQTAKEWLETTLAYKELESALINAQNRKNECVSKLQVLEKNLLEGVGNNITTKVFVFGNQVVVITHGVGVKLVNEGE